MGKQSGGDFRETRHLQHKNGPKTWQLPREHLFFFRYAPSLKGKTREHLSNHSDPGIFFFFFCSCQFPRKTAKTTFIDSNIKGGFYGPKDIAPGWLLPSGVIILPNPNNAFLQGKFLKITINFVFVWFPPKNGSHLMTPWIYHSQDSSGKYPGVFGNSLT